MTSVKLGLASERDTEALALSFANNCYKGIIYLRGDLGAGKTCFSQYFISHAGFSGRVTSPTYTLLEPYELNNRNIYHFDLYRLEDEEELLFLGCDDYFKAALESEPTEGKPSLCLVEWPEKAPSVLPRADIELRIEHVHAGGNTQARQLLVFANSHQGEQMLKAMRTELKSLEKHV